MRGTGLRCHRKVLPLPLVVLHGPPPAALTAITVTHDRQIDPPVGD